MPQGLGCCAFVDRNVKQHMSLCLDVVCRIVFANISVSIIARVCVVEIFNPSKPTGYSIYRRVEHSEVLPAAHIVYLFVFCVCQNTRPLVLYTVLIDSCVCATRNMFTAR